MTRPRSDAELDELLRRSFDDAVPEDDGFSARVVHALPARSRAPGWVLPVAVVVGVLLAWLALVPSPLWQQATREWLDADFRASFAVVCALLLGTGVLGCAWAMDEAG